jgi:succinate-semialdehyde dehydrogenase/glutarate-semialdehyde dehydrogenase
VIDEFEELSALLVRESGRPHAEIAALELLPAIDTLRWIASAGIELLEGQRIGVPRSVYPLKRARIAYEPAGIVAVIGAGSAPLAQPLCQVAAALIGGNGVIFKPAPRACLAGERLTRLLARAGLPEGLVRAVHGGPELGEALAGADGIARVLFTGGRRAGERVARTCAEHGRGVVLELGGADPMIVLADANVPRAVAGGLWAACAGAGQPHGTVKRIYVAREIHDRFVAELVAAAERLTPGDPLDEATQLGPLASMARRERLTSAIEMARAQGADLRCGAPLQPNGLPGAFHSPAVLSGVGAALRERIPGPLLTIAPMTDTLHAVALANSGSHGLGASVWTADRYRGERIAHELRAGTVWLNDHLPSPGLGRAPWGAIGGGSIWRSQGADGLRACVEPKLITWDPPAGRSPWWQPYDHATARAAQAVAELRSLRDADRERALRQGTFALIRVAGRSLRYARRR